jgi:hypothetical protein
MNFFSKKPTPKEAAKEAKREARKEVRVSSISLLELFFVVRVSIE